MRDQRCCRSTLFPHKRPHINQWQHIALLSYIVPGCKGLHLPTSYPSAPSSWHQYSSSGVPCFLFLLHNLGDYVKGQMQKKKKKWTLCLAKEKETEFFHLIFFKCQVIFKANPPRVPKSRQVWTDAGGSGLLMANDHVVSARQTNDSPPNGGNVAQLGYFIRCTGVCI